ncbi:MAG: acetylglutamate kinase [Candidatus Lutacidiplasmatales archaeon]
MTTARSPWVLKVGGRELRPGEELQRLSDSVATAVRTGRPTVVVHGGGDEISERAEALGLPTERVLGQRKTDAATLEIVVEVLAGRINLRLVQALQAAGVPAFGLSGISGRLLSVVPTPSLGFVGTPDRVRPHLLRTLLGDGLTPVVAPLGLGPDGTVHNVNADLAASAIAGALGVELALLTDVPAVLDQEGRPIPTLRVGQLRGLVESGVATDGMIPKLDAAERALNEGAPSVWIGDLDGLGSPGRGTTVLGRRPLPYNILPMTVPGAGKR